MEASQRGEGKKAGSAGRAAATPTEAPASLDFVADVPLQLTVEVGRARLLVREVLELEKGSIVELDRASGEPADVLVNGRLVARGELSMVDDRLAVTLTEVVGAARRGGREGAP
ncbi:MAG: flagellar motor switch protein FliN [Deltaproteobacteria bacterium]|nr:flagellar motor switch protein FliN [Deltaproteobacteria bacterium]